MNIFALDTSPIAAATYLFDAHLNKMLLESAQILSTVHWIVDCGRAETLYRDGQIYAPTHAGRDCVRWAAASRDNFEWLLSHAAAINKERYFRFPLRPRHKSAMVIFRMPLPELPDTGPTPFAIDFKRAGEYPRDPVAAYHQYYRTEKAHMARWTRRGAPDWWE